MVHQVERGETLYSIAWRYDLDVRKLARINGIKAPFVISQGQMLSLDTSAIRAQPLGNRVASQAETASTVNTRSSGQEKPAAQPAAKVVFSNDWKWQWPVKGKVVESYNPKELRKGIKIKAVGRSAVRSSGPGVVVYAGEGLRGYGKLVIIKHSEILLSAYAQNEQIMVKEGQTVKQMEIISRLGANGTLHFEIRKDGYPINPVSYLR